MFETKVRSFTISLSNPSAIFYSGQRVDGKVTLVVENDLKLRDILLIFKGYAHVHWSESHGSGKNRRTVHYSSNELYFEQQAFLIPRGQDDHILRPGSYEYQFSFQIPPNSPTSFESSIGKVRYLLKANIDRPWAFDTHTDCLITVLTPFDLNTNPGSLNGAENEDFKTICCWCCESDPITAKIGVDRVGYVPGEAIVTKGEVMNGSNRTMSEVSVNILQEVEYITPRKTRRAFLTAATCTLGELGAKKPMSIHGTRLVVPPLPPSGLVGCNIINIHYYVQVHVDPKGPALSLGVAVPLVIGSIPLRQTVEQYGAPPPLAPTPSAPSDPAYPPPPSAMLPSHIPAPSYAPSIFGPSEIQREDGYVGQTGGSNAVAPEQPSNTWAPSYSYYNWN